MKSRAWQAGIGFATPLLIWLTLSNVACDRSIDFEAQESKQGAEVKFAQPVEEILQNHLSALLPKFQEDLIIQALIQSNQEHAATTKIEILEWDRQWVQAPDSSPLIQERLAHPCSAALMNYQQQDSGYEEIFVTDRFGLNVCQTNRTSDWYQADEDWWKESYAEGKGKIHFGRIEFDESAMSESIPLYFPVYHPENGKLIGIAKAVLSLERIRQEL